MQRFPEWSVIIGQYKTVFPPLLIELQRHLAVVKRVVELTRDTAAASKTGKLSADYWQWYDGDGRNLIKQLNIPQLTSEWARLGKLHVQFMNAANSCVKAAATGDKIHVSEGLERVFALSSELIGVLVGGSLSELMAAISSREQALNARHEQDFMEAAQIGRFSVRLSDNSLYGMDANFLKFLGGKPAEIENSDVLQIIDSKSFQRLLTAAASGDASTRTTLNVKHKDGQKIALDVTASFDRQGAEKVLICYAANVSQAESDAQQRRLLSTAIDVSDQIVMITNHLQEIVYVNPAFTKLTGYEAREALGKNPRFLQGADTSQATRIAIREAMIAGRNLHVEMLNYTKEGLRYWIELYIVQVRDDSGDITHFVAVQHDITERKATEQAIARIALEDHLTGLPNRRAAESRLDAEWNRAHRSAEGFAIAVVDIDRFKRVNDQYGHLVGDEALKHVADVMASSLRGGDWIARWGGEEFLLCFHSVDSHGANKAAERVRKLVKSSPLKTPFGELPLTISMGVALYSPENRSVDELLAQADALVYEAKNSGRDKVFCSGLTKARKGSVMWEGTQVQSALHEGRVLSVYQSIVNLRTGAVVADEALARIRAKDGALVPAANFIQAAEALHLVAAIDKITSANAIDHCARVEQYGSKNVGLMHFINLSYQFLANAENVEVLLDQARRFCVSRGYQMEGVKPLAIEITERHSGDILTLKKSLQPLMDFGFRLAIDDFGSGHSSFLYLAELPVDFIKIEGWMVKRVTHDQRVRQLVESIVSSATQMKVTTIAECVEDSETAKMLCDIGVDWAQGDYFAKAQIDESGSVS